MALGCKAGYMRGLPCAPRTMDRAMVPIARRYLEKPYLRAAPCHPVSRRPRNRDCALVLVSGRIATRRPLGYKDGYSARAHEPTSPRAHEPPSSGGSCFGKGPRGYPQVKAKIFPSPLDIGLQ